MASTSLDLSTTFTVFPLGLPFRLVISLAFYTAAWEASGHFDGSGTEVDLQIMFVQPGEPEYHALLAEAGDHKQDAFGGYNHVNDFVDAPGLIKRFVYVVNQDQLGQLAGQKFGLGNKILVNEVSGSTGINHGFRG